MPGLFMLSIQETYRLVSLFSGGELILANVAELTGEIFGKIFPLDALLFFVVDPAANVTYILHNIYLRMDNGMFSD